MSLTEQERAGLHDVNLTGNHSSGSTMRSAVHRWVGAASPPQLMETDEYPGIGQPVMKPSVAWKLFVAGMFKPQPLADAMSWGLLTFLKNNYLPHRALLSHKTPWNTLTCFSKWHQSYLGWWSHMCPVGDDRPIFHPSPAVPWASSTRACPHSSGNCPLAPLVSLIPFHCPFPVLFLKTPFPQEKSVFPLFIPLWESHNARKALWVTDENKSGWQPFHCFQIQLDITEICAFNTQSLLEYPEVFVVVFVLFFGTSKVFHPSLWFSVNVLSPNQYILINANFLILYLYSFKNILVLW